jgi:hypothetical protein
MTESSGNADKKIDGFLPISEQDKMEELKRLVSVLRYNLAIVYDCRMGTGRPEEIQTLLERISAELQVSLRILVDGDEVSFFIPLDAEESDFFPGAMTSGWFQTATVHDVEKVHGLSPEERKCLDELEDLTSRTHRGRGSYTCKPEETPERIEEILRRIADVSDGQTLWTWIDGRDVRFHHVHFSEDLAAMEDLDHTERRLFIELFDLVMKTHDEDEVGSYRCKPDETPERIQELLHRIEGTDAYGGDPLKIWSKGREVFFRSEDAH